MLTLKEHRRRAVISTRELAEKANVSPATIWRIERGDVAKIRPATMRAIAGALNVSPTNVDEFAGVLADTGITMEEGVANTHHLLDLAAQQGVKPITDPSQLVGDFWPDEERAEDFAFTIYAWRQEGDNSRELD